MMDIVTKDFPVSAGEATDEYPNGTFEVILSAPTKDRDGEVIDTKAFEPLPDHITFDTDHSMTCDSVVGSGVPSYADDGTLRVKGGYAGDERSQTIRQKVADGHIRTTSVTFMAAERSEKDGVPHVTKAELLNGTFTPIPSNREAVVLSAKSIVAHDVAEKVGARNSAKDADTIQAMHDGALTLGALCGGKSAASAEAKEPTVGELLTRDEWRALEGMEPLENEETSGTESAADEAATEQSAGQSADEDADQPADEGSEEAGPPADDKSAQRLRDLLTD